MPLDDAEPGVVEAMSGDHLEGHLANAPRIIVESTLDGGQSHVGYSGTGDDDGEENANAAAKE